MTHVTCRLTTKNRDQLRNPTLGNRVWATFTFLVWPHYHCGLIAKFHYTDTDTDTDFFAAKLRWVRAGPCRARVRVRVVEFSYKLTSRSSRPARTSRTSVDPSSLRVVDSVNLPAAAAAVASS